MIIDCISDLHGFVPTPEQGDLLIVAGDLTARDSAKEHIAMWGYLCKLNYKRIIVIAGNHDNFLQTKEGDSLIREFSPNLQYLCDEGGTYGDYKIWGSPWTKTFNGMNPHCKAFTFDTEKELMDKWALIPHDIDILITHSPPYGVLDKTEKGERVGSKTLQFAALKFHSLKLWVMGHIHESYGEEFPGGNYPGRIVNASHVNARYKPVNRPLRIILEEKLEFQKAENNKDLRLGDH